MRGIEEFTICPVAGFLNLITLDGTHFPKDVHSTFSICISQDSITHRNSQHVYIKSKVSHLHETTALGYTSRWSHLYDGSAGMSLDGPTKATEQQSIEIS